MPDKDQIYIFSNDELSLIKNTFAENETLIFAIRKVLLQFPISQGERDLISSLPKEVFTVLRKRIIPKVSNVFPLGQIPSILTTLTNDLKVKDIREMQPQFDAKQLQIDYLEQQFAVLEGTSTDEPIRLDKMGELKNKDGHESFVDMTAYLFLLGYVDPNLIMIKTIAGDKGETLEQLNKRMKRDSAK